MESLALLAVAAAIVYHSWKGISVADFTRLNAAIAALAAPLAGIAARLNELTVDDEDQAQVDSDAEQLENIANQLNDLATGGTAAHVDDAGVTEVPTTEGTSSTVSTPSSDGISSEENATPESGGDGLDSPPVDVHRECRVGGVFEEVEEVAVGDQRHRNHLRKCLRQFDGSRKVQGRCRFARLALAHASELSL